VAANRVYPILQLTDSVNTSHYEIVWNSESINQHSLKLALDGGE
jgi:hypothetical protein